MNSENSKNPKPHILILKLATNLRFKNRRKDYCLIKF